MNNGPAQSVVTLAHLSDVHLGPMLRVPLAHLNAKRAAGLVNWYRKRRHIHLPEVATALARDVVAQKPDHIIVSGDLINIGLPKEADRAAIWLKHLGEPQDVTVVPGNHDIYARDRWRRLGIATVGAWHPHFVPCMRGQRWQGDGMFPFVRVIGDGALRLAVIGLNSAIETPPLIAHGKLGEAQRARLKKNLIETRDAGLVRVVVLHHPPLPGVTAPHHHLLDAPELVETLRSAGAELVLHGHNHRRMINHIEGPDGPIPIVGVPSASAACSHKGEPLARAHIFEFSKSPTLQISMLARGLDAEHGKITDIERVTIRS